MRARRFLAALLAVGLLLLSLAAGLGWVLWQRSPLQLVHQQLSMPLAARFVPRAAALSLHLLTSPELPEDYARSLAPVRQRRDAAAAVARLRDGAFATAGLDYAGELAGWLGDETTLVLFSADGDSPAGWLLALRSRDPGGARRFLQRFWQTRSLAGSDLQVTSYRGMGLISGKGTTWQGREVVPLATALIDDELVLLASGRGLLEQALDVSQLDELNQAADARFLAALDRLGQGAALITARPEAWADWLGLPAVDAADDVLPLTASLRPQGSDLLLEALVPLAQPALAARLGGESAALLEGLRGSPSSLGLLADPAALLGSDSPPAQQALLRQALAALNGPLPALVAAADHGPLLWAQGAGGWLLGTAAGQPDADALSAALAPEGYAPAPLAAADRNLLVWSRLALGARRSGAGGLQVQLAGARLQEGGQAWWADKPEPLLQPAQARGEARRRVAQLAALETPQAPLQWALAPAPTRELLRRWRPWQLISALAGGGEQAAQGLALSLEPLPQDRAAPEASAPLLRLRARLELG